MNTNYFEVLADPTSTIPCYFSDSETFEILYFNEPMKQLMGATDNSYIGQKCYEYIHELTSPCDRCPFELGIAQKDAFTMYHFYCARIKTHVKSLLTWMDYNGRAIQFNKFYEADADYELLEYMTLSAAMSRCAQIMSITDKEQQIDAFLSLLCEYYASDRAFLYIMNTRSDGAKKVYTVTAETVPDTTLPPFSSEYENRFFNWVSTCANMNILEVDIHENNYPNLTMDDLDYYKQRQLSSLSACPSFSSGGKLERVLVLTNRKRRNEQSEQSFMKLVAQFLKSSIEIETKATSNGNAQYIDTLTGVLNREKYNEALQALKYDGADNIGIVFVNVNGLKKTNQFYGLDAGDKLIQNSVEVINRFFPFPWYRLSGDEFVCFVTEWSGAQFSDTLFQLHDELSAMPQRLFAVGSAWGTRSNDIDKLVETADTMMFIDKQTFYTDFDPNKMEFSDHVLQDLLLAVKEEEFLVYLQPKIALESETVVGAEALIRRFDKKSNKMVFPDQFIPLYEKKSIIRHVDLFVLRKVCQTLQEWNKHGKQLTVSVNLSRVTLLEHGIVYKFSEICDDYDIPHEQIVVEVTERVGLIENEVESPLIDQFKKYGFTISLDDFGCAYSNIVTLATISVDEVKIDKSLVDNILTNPKNKSIVENMIRMVDSFGETKTLAEGVETPEQANCLRDCNCQYAQGYLYSRPIPSEEFFEKYIDC